MNTAVEVTYKLTFEEISKILGLEEGEEATSVTYHNGQNGYSGGLTVKTRKRPADTEITYVKK